MNTTAYFDASNPDTPPGLTPAIGMGNISGIPSEGTGLAGKAFVPGTRIFDIVSAREAAQGTPDATFTATELAYAARKSDTTVTEFLGDDGASVQGNGDLEMGPSALMFSGYIYIPPGIHELKITSDDGFDLNIGGVDFSEFASGRGSEPTARVAEFDGGLYKMDLLYFDQGGGMSLSMEIDGLPVDASAFYQSEADFTNSTAPAVPVEDYHPSFFLGADSLESTPIDGTATDGADKIAGKGADDVIDGGAGDDHITGGYGDDTLTGGDGDDVLDGGRGNDVIDGGAGNDTLIIRSDAGIQSIGQLNIGKPTRDDPDGEVDLSLNKLSAYADQPIEGDDVVIGGAGQDTFLIEPLLNGKLDIIEKHVQADGSINWAGVAGENNELHDHWVDSIGINIIADYNAAEDNIAVIGHTATPYVTYADVMGDDALESIITVISVQHGNGGAHDRDLIGQVIVHGDLVDVDDIQTDDGVTYGIVDTYDEVAEALHPKGDEKLTTLADGTVVKGYDTREPMQMMPGMDMGNGGHNGHGGPGTNVLGPVTGDPFAAMNKDGFDEAMLAPGAGDDEGYIETRAPFEQLGTTEVTGQTIDGTNSADTLAPADTTPETGLPGALGYWSFDSGTDGAYGDDTGRGGAIKAYTLYENQALLNTAATVEGPKGAGDEALYFNGEDSFAFLDHDAAMNFTQGTIALWVRPDDLGETSAFVTKDHTGAVDGGHF
ncbi:MAG: hypothetical protein AAF762_05150, partial [Pseudomonadota bacterium]